MSKPHHNYSLEPRPFGEGGQAEVIKAMDKRTNQFVAFKRLRLDLRNDQDAIARMRREIDVQTKISHPNIMPILDYSEHYYWYTMPIAEKTITELDFPIDDLSLYKIIKEIAQGLLCAHNKGFIHRDINPRNILKLPGENTEGKWVVSDWGLVRRLGQTSVVRTQAGYLFGTAGFAAPEMEQNAHSVDESVDVYGLGRIAAYCLTGNWPIQNIPLCPIGPFHDFIERTTKLYRSERVNNMKEVLEMIENIKVTYLY